MIVYKGKSYDSNICMPLTDEEFSSLKAEFYRKPSLEDVKKQLECIHKRNGVNVDKVDRYYFRELWSKVKMSYNNWSIEEAWNCKKVIEYFYGKTLRSEKTFPKHLGLEKNIETAMRLAGYGVASKPSNFKLKVVDEVLDKYNINGRWIDYSCGWGVRMLGALKHNVEYYGIDPNFELVDALTELASVYKDVNNCDSKIDIRCQGSEEYIPEWEGIMGLAFSSPPYYNLEDYKTGKQSWNESVTYEMWLDGYLEKTIQNLHRYLIDGGILAINIKNLHDGEQLADDARNIILKNGFEYAETLTFENTRRRYGHAQPKNQTEFKDTDEGIFIFKKVTS